MHVLVALFLILLVAGPAGGQTWPVEVAVPAQAAALVVPATVTLPENAEAGPTGAWELSDGAARIAAQPCGSPRTLCFLLPVAASSSAVTRKLTLRRAASAEPAFQWEEAEGKYLRLFEGRAPVLTYNFGMILKPGVPEDRRRSSYFHPLHAPDGALLTDDFPADHPHHRGLSWMWLYVDVGGERHSLWEIRGIRQRFERRLEQTAGPVCAGLAVQNGWYVGEKKVAAERVEARVFRATPQGRAVDVTLTFEAIDRPIVLTGEQPDRKGYGGLSLRFAPRKDTAIVTPNGAQEKDSNLVPAAWADLSGRFAGGRRAAGAAIFVDQRNPGFPNGWTLRKYGFLGVAWPGMSSVTLEPGQPVTLRYRLWLHGGDAAAACVPAQYAAFARPLPARLGAVHPAGVARRP